MYSCRTLEITCPQVKEFARRQAVRMGLSKVSTDVIEQVIERLMEGRVRKVSLRDVLRVLRRAKALENQPIRH